MPEVASAKCSTIHILVCLLRRLLHTTGQASLLTFLHHAVIYPRIGQSPTVVRPHSRAVNGLGVAGWQLPAAAFRI